MMRPITALAVAAVGGAAVGAALHASTAPAQMPPMAPSMSVCGPTLQIIRGLARGYDERVVAVGERKGGSQVLLVTSPDGATWTLLELAPHGREACSLASGQRWRFVAPLEGVEQ